MATDTDATIEELLPQQFERLCNVGTTDRRDL
jgi:hypothetical protein